jgi:hypothetical protein
VGAVARALGLIHVKRRNTQTNANAYVICWANICEQAGIGLADEEGDTESGGVGETDIADDGEVPNVDRDANLASQPTNGTSIGNLGKQSIEVQNVGRDANMASQLQTETPYWRLNFSKNEEEEEGLYKYNPPPPSSLRRAENRDAKCAREGFGIQDSGFGEGGEAALPLSQRFPKPPVANPRPENRSDLQSPTNPPRGSPVSSGNGGERAVHVSGERAEWLELENELLRFPMGDATTALAAARDHGLSPGDVRKLIAFCRANVDRWENPSGALWKRILVGWPGQAVGDGWPEPRGV